MAKTQHKLQRVKCLTGLVKLEVGVLIYGRYHVGSSWFVGPERFTALCRRGMEELKRLDETLHEAVTRESLGFWWDPNGPTVLHKRFGISKEFIEWKEQGIIAGVLYCHFWLKFLDSRPLVECVRMTPLARANAVRADVRLWMQAHEFPGQLIAWVDPM